MTRYHTLLGWTRRRPHQFILLWMGVSLLLVLGAGTYNLLAERRLVTERAAAASQSYADAIANRIGASMAKIDVLLTLVAKSHGSREHPIAHRVLTGAFEEALQGHPELISIMVIDRNGSLASYSRPLPPKSANFSDRAYFRYHQTHGDTAMHIGEPIRNRFDGRMTVPVSMRLNDEQGRFDGVVFIGLDVDYFEKEFGRLNLGSKATIAISHSDGTMLFRHPSVPGAIGSSIADWTVFRTKVVGHDAGAGESVCPVDHVTRIHAFRRLAHYPLIAYAGVSIQDAGAGWSESIALKLPVLLTVLLLLGGSGWFVYRQLLRESQTRLRLKQSLRRAGHEAQRAEALNEALQKAGDFRAAVLDSAACGIIVTDVFGEIVFFSHAAGKILGFPPAEVLGKMSPLVFHRTEDVRAALQRIRPGDTPYLLMVAHLNAHPGREWTFIRKDGTTVAVSITITPLKACDGRLEGFVTIFNDRTELNRLEGMKSDFVSVVSHELRTPVTAIRGALSLHQAAVGDTMPASQQKLLAIATSNCDKLVRIVSDILDIDKLARNKLTLELGVEPVAALLERAVTQTQPFADQYAVSYRISECAPDLHLSVDAGRFQQILVNLLSNAAKFSQPHSEVMVNARMEEGDVVIRVVDYGIGIPDSFKPHVFERFSQHSSALTRKTGGTGLGLAITRMLVEAHEGSIEFHSEYGIGTTFTLRFPNVQMALSDDRP